MKVYCNNARNMTERNMKRKYGKKRICLSQTQFRGGQLEEVLAEWCYRSGEFLHLEMYRDCSIIREKYSGISLW